MGEVGRVTAELTFLPKSAGGRNNPPGPPWGHGGAWYMPHLVVVGGAGTYLGVRFVGGPFPVLGQPAAFELSLMYPGVDYSPLVPGAAVEVREGGRGVAGGRVLARCSPDAEPGAAADGGA